MKFLKMMLGIPILKKNERFPDPKTTVMGEMLISAQTEDLFVFDGKKWVLVGGQYLEPSTRQRVYRYLDDGWEYAEILKYDLLNYLDTSEYWDNIFYGRIIDLASKILPSADESD